VQRELKVSAAIKTFVPRMLHERSEMHIGGREHADKTSPPLPLVPPITRFEPDKAVLVMPGWGRTAILRMPPVAPTPARALVSHFSPRPAGLGEQE